MRREDKFGRLLSNRKLITVFVCVVALIMLVSVVTLVSEKNADSGETTADESAVYAAALSSTAENMKGSFLLAVCNEESRSIRLLACVTADSKNGSVDITYIPTGQVCSVSSSKGTIAGHFENTGKDGLIYAVRACGVNIDRYVIIDESNLFPLLKLFPEQTIDVRNEVRHDYKGISYIIEKGTQTFTAENLEKYFIYLCDNRAEESEELTELLMRFLRLSFVNEGEETVEKRYYETVNLVSTDISAMDIAAYSPLLERFSESE